MRVRILIPRRKPKKLVSRSNKRSAQMALVIFITAVVGTLYALLGDSGLMAVMKMRGRAAQLQYEIATKESANRELREVIRPLRDEDPEAIEKLAREQHFMVRPGDTVYILPKEAEQPAPSTLDDGRSESRSPTAPSLPRRR